MAVGDIWELTLRGTILGEQMLNVFNYRETVAIGGDVGGADIAQWLWDTIGAELILIVSNQVDYTQVDALQVTGGVGIGSYTIVSGTGNTVGDCLPSFVAYGFRYNRASQASRHGYKRFAGVPEGHGTGGTYTPTGSLVTDLINKLESDLFDPTTTLDGRLEPVILSRVVNGAVRPTPVAFPISTITFTGVTSQNTRKP